MGWVDPQALFWLWAAPVVFVLYLIGRKRRRRALEGFARPGTLGRIESGPAGGRRFAAALLLSFATGLVAVALAGPFYGYREREVERRGVDLIVALDLSRSMLATDIRPSRIERARREVLDLMPRLRGDRIGLVAFAGTAFLQCPLTSDTSGFGLFLQSIGPDDMPVGGTDLAEAVDVAVRSFDPKSPAERAVILITDGEPTSDDAASAVSRAKASGIPFYVLGVGTPEGAPVPQEGGGFKRDGSGGTVVSRLSDSFLRELASVTGGVYAVSAPDDSDWEAIYDGGIRARLEARALGAQKARVPEDRYQWPLGMAVVLLLAEILLPLRGRKAAGLAALLLASAVVDPGYAATSGEVREGIRKYEQGDYQGALESFQKADEERPGTPEIRFDVGTARYKSGDFRAAESDFQEAAKAGDAKLKARSLFNQGNARYRQNRLEEAITSYEEALKADSKDEDARKNLDFVREQLKKKEQEQQKSKDKSSGEQQKKQDASSSDGKSGQGQKKQSGSPEKPGQKGEEKQGEQKSGASAGRQPERESPQRADARRRAENILNRLDDRPGRTLMPAYGKRRVERDW